MIINDNGASRGALAFVMVLAAAFPVFSGDWGLEVGAGLGAWQGSWNQTVDAAYTDIGLTSGGLMIPALSGAASYRGRPFWGPVGFYGTAGFGLWSGSIGGWQDGDLDRASSTLVWTLELMPGLEALFPLASGRLVTQLRLGVGFALGSITTIDALPGMRSVSKVPLEFLNRLIGIASLGVGYRPSDALAFLVRADGGLSDFDATEWSDPALLGRLSLVVDYTLSRKGAAR